MLRHLEIPELSNNATGKLEQKKTTSRTPVSQGTDIKVPAQTRPSVFKSGSSYNLNPNPQACNLSLCEQQEADQAAHLHSLINDFVIRYLDNITHPI